MTKEITMVLSESDLENLIDSVQDAKTRASVYASPTVYETELKELLYKLQKIRARHHRQNYPQD